MQKKAINIFFRNNLEKIIILFGSIAWVLTIVKSGWRYSYGYGFWGANGFDGVWHISLINNLSKFSLENPVFGGENIKNYHIGFDLFVGMLHKFLQIPVSVLYFQILPVIFAILIGVLTYKYVFEWTRNKQVAIVATIFTYFGGSMGWVLGKGESTFWAQQGISTLINPPYALSLILMLMGLIYLNRRNYLSILFFSLLIFFKVYAGLLIIGGLAVASLFEYFTIKKYFYFKVFLATLFLSLLLYLPFNQSGASLIKWEPFWFLENLFAAGDRLVWPKMAEAMLSYKNQSVVVKFVLAYGFALFVFTIGNYWTRLIFLKDIFRKIDALKMMTLSIILAGFLIPVFFVQAGTPWNTIQFMYYSLFFSGLLSAISLKEVSFKTLILVVLITIPTTFISLKDIYVTNTPPAIISNTEIEALEFLRVQPDTGIVLTYPYDLAVNVAPIPNKIPLYKYATTSYVPAYTAKNIFFERTNLEIMGYDWENRRNSIKWFFSTLDAQKAKEFLVVNNIKYLYLAKEMSPLHGELLKLGTEELGLQKVFDNKEILIFKVN